MPGDRVVVDGLWRCLCPSVDAVFLSKPIDRLFRQIFPTRTGPILTNAYRAGNDYIQRPRRRQYSSVATPRARHVNHSRPATNPRQAYLNRIVKKSPWLSGALFEGSDPVKDKNLRYVPTRDIYETLKDLGDAEDTYTAIVRLVEYLVKERGEKPNAALYEALMTANVSRRMGSAKAAGQLFKEMMTLGIPTTPDNYLAVLKVTAVHPDYILMSHVLHEMRNRWYDLTPGAEISVILSLLRDCQYELALQKLEHLHRSPINVPPWLLDIFLYVFGERGFHEETLAILKYRQRVVDNLKRAPLSLNTWHFLLEVFSRDAFYTGVKYIWSHVVSSDCIHPPDGVVLGVLNSASMNGDSELAMSAIQTLSARGAKLELHHYEPLINIYIQHGNLHRAFWVLCIMAKAGLSPDLGSTRPIFAMLRDQPTSMHHALRILHELKHQNPVPAAAFNVLLEATALHEEFRVALDLYRSVRQICRGGPDLDTYDVLLRYCNTPKQMHFLLGEMEALSLKPTRLIYDHLVRICAMQDDYEPAFRYLELMGASTPAGAPQTWWVGRNTALCLLRTCIQARDPRFESLLAECRRRGLVHDDDIKTIVSVGAEAAEEKPALLASSEGES
ncbi:hypothetical protein F5Y17DRAFT_277081 [Xylariaceae sp. FL0594]|nr:hypothetical protein F5Y17DRAFT_277081 [Xylariaceae sp. FL0594]